MRRRLPPSQPKLNDLDAEIAQAEKDLEGYVAKESELRRYGSHDELFRAEAALRTEESLREEWGRRRIMLGTQRMLCLPIHNSTEDIINAWIPHPRVVEAIAKLAGVPFDRSQDKLATVDRLLASGNGHDPTPLGTAARRYVNVELRRLVADDPTCQELRMQMERARLENRDARISDKNRVGFSSEIHEAQTRLKQLQMLRRFGATRAEADKKIKKARRNLAQISKELRNIKSDQALETALKINQEAVRST